MPLVSWADKGNFAKVTTKLVCICLFLSLGSVIFGYDTGMFGGVQAIPGFVARFGECNAKGVCTLSASRVSLMQSIAFVGKIIGTSSAGPIIERFNHRNAMFFMCFCCFVGVVIEATSKHYAQYTVGRIVLYFAVGITENAVPTYQSEIVPAGARGAVVSSIQFFIAVGGFISSGVNKRFSTDKTDEGWLVATCLQALFPMLIAIGLPFVPISPRWLISKGRSEEAVRVLIKVRPKEDGDNGSCEAEVAAIDEALQHQVDKGPWLDLFRGTNARRTMIASVVFAFAQFTGQAFTSQYGPRFYTTVGLGSMAFTYSLINSAIGLLTCGIAMIAMDRVGRRPILIFGGIVQGIFLFLIAGLGLLKNPSTNVSHFFVACVILFSALYAATWGATLYLLAAEIGTARLREKTMAFSSSVNVLAAFIVSFTLPYLLNSPYANLQSNIGWIYGSFAFAAGAFAYFCVPETKNRALEELDACFEERISARKFSSFVATGAAAQVAVLETVGAGVGKDERIEQVEKA
ncbi:hypothetical protein EHS25_000609 [Saitozyma podzolica]|uniref:Major facilitator superfamily (MFS) profile domain-containing protein n=1 Tax=Saitozyma podzolica TaxID=1890683 RepID=A0A427YWN8_9TREE|nr:hypothetical protein EHS25_000609 [Saitozyma podzolica]